MKLRNISPWNWLQKEAEGRTGSEVPVTRGGGQPGHPLTAFHREMDRLFDQALREFGNGFPGLSGRSWAPDFFRPSLDISESPEQYTIHVETPGVSKDDIQISVENDALIIRGEKKEEDKRNEKQYHYVERSYGSFQRVLSLPQDADPDSLRATFRDGVLTINVGRRSKQESGARQIEIE